MPAVNCPRDKRPMVLDEYKAHPRHECKVCKGVLLEGRHVAAATARLRSGIADTSAGSPLLLKLPESSLACPHDGTPMRTALYSDVEIDVCPVCRSLWLDRGEYERIAAIDRERRAAGQPSAGSGGADGADDMSGFIEEAVRMLMER